MHVFGGVLLPFLHFLKPFLFANTLQIHVFQKTFSFLKQILFRETDVFFLHHSNHSVHIFLTDLSLHIWCETTFEKNL